MMRDAFHFNETMKFGQLIEYNIRNIFPEKSNPKYGGIASLTAFYKKSKLRKSVDQQYESYKVFFIVCPTRSLPKYIKTKVLTTCFYLIQSFLKSKKKSETNLPT